MGGRTRWIGLVAAIWALATTGTALAVDFGVRSLDGLSRVGVEIVAGPDVDTVALEMAVVERLADLGIEVDQRAAAVLSVDAAASAGLVSAGLTLSQPVSLERDPLVATHVPTWSLGEAERQESGVEVAFAVQEVLDRVLERFAADWLEVNGSDSGGSLASRLGN